MTYKMHTAEPDPANGVYSTLQALENLVQQINLREAGFQYDQIVSAFPLGNSAVVITETLYR